MKEGQDLNEVEENISVRKIMMSKEKISELQHSNNRRQKACQLL